MRKTHDELMLQKFEAQYPGLSLSFKQIQQEQYQIFARKNMAYGMDNIALGTKLETEEEKNISVSSIWIRCMDKMNRLKNLILFKKENTINESSMDAWVDLSIYTIISQLVSRGLWVK